MPLHQRAPHLHARADACAVAGKADCEVDARGDNDGRIVPMTRNPSPVAVIGWGSWPMKEEKMTMREKMARGMYAIDAERNRLGTPWQRLRRDVKEEYTKQVDAALDALMKPTQGMCDAGYDDADHSIESITSLAPPPREQPRLIFQAMIRAAKEGQSSDEADAR